MKSLIGYKGTYNFKCKELTYEIGKIYEIDNIKLCEYGFHYCPKIEDILKYCKISEDLKILEIEDIGDERIETKDKICTNKIKILREVPIEEHKLFEFDKNGNLIYCKNFNGYKFWNEYDKNNNLIHYKNNDGFEKWYRYDKNNNKIYSKDSNKYEEWKEYNENNNLIHYKDSNGYKKWYEYDKNNNLIHYKDSERYEYWYEYDKNGNLMSYKYNKN